MATYKQCLRCGEVLALHNFIGEGITCRKCLNPKENEKRIEKIKLKNEKWREDNHERYKELARSNYHKNKKRYSSKSKEVEIIFKKDSYMFNLWLRDKGISCSELLNNSVSSDEFININNELIEKKNTLKKEKLKIYIEKNADKIKNYKKEYYQQKRKNENNNSKPTIFNSLGSG